jgi:hypothetical protein
MILMMRRTMRRKTLNVDLIEELGEMEGKMRLIRIPNWRRILMGMSIRKVKLMRKKKFESFNSTLNISIITAELLADRMPQHAYCESYASNAFSIYTKLYTYKIA